MDVRRNSAGHNQRTYSAHQTRRLYAKHHLESKISGKYRFFLTLPVILLNTIANHEIEPFFTFFKVNTAGGFWDHPIGHIAVIVALLLLPAGAIIAIRPMFQKGTDGKRKFYLVNVLLAGIMLALFVIISGALISEIYEYRS
jgi:hypothetical protein